MVVYDEEDYATAVEGVRAIMEVCRAMGAKDFFIGGDLNIKLQTRGARILRV